MLVLVCVSVIILGCSSNPQDRNLHIVCTTGLLGDLVVNVAGDAGDLVVVLIPSGNDPHSYTATHIDLEALERADVVFHHGLGLEKELIQDLERVSETAKVHSVAEGLPTNLLRRTSPEVVDPHIWLDPLLWKEAVGPVVAALSELRPNRFGVFKLNGERYRARLDTLHQWVESEITTVPPGQRQGVTVHEAFGYLGRAYGLEIRGLLGQSEIPSHNLVDWAVERRVKTVFPQSHVSESGLDTLLASLGDRGIFVERADTVFTDTLDRSGSGATYVSTMRATVTTIVDALR